MPRSAAGWDGKGAWPRRAILKARQAFGLEAGDPFASGALAYVGGFGRGLQSQTAEHKPDKALSTARRQTGIPVDVHPVPPWALKSRNLSILGPDRMDNLMKAHI